MVDVSPTLSVIKLNVHEINTPVKNQIGRMDFF